MGTDPKANNTVERTAVADFTLDGRAVVKGTVVPLNRTQLAKLVAAGCVRQSDEENADVPKTELPELQTEGAAEADQGSSKGENVSQAEASAKVGQGRK